MKTFTLDDIQSEAASFVKELNPSSEGAVVVTLSGELGAGKTAFVQAIARALGVQESVTSPTFVIERVYELTRQTFSRLVHIDAYRLNDSKELLSLGWNALVADTHALIFLEWPERVADVIPKRAHRISLTCIEGDRREISYGGAH